jgi:hypothetical protein
LVKVAHNYEVIAPVVTDEELDVRLYPIAERLIDTPIKEIKLLDYWKLFIPADQKTRINPSKDRIIIYDIDRGHSETWTLRELLVVPPIDPNTKHWILLAIFIGFGMAVGLVCIVMLWRKQRSIHQEANFKIDPELLAIYGEDGNTGNLSSVNEEYLSNRLSSKEFR